MTCSRPTWEQEGHAKDNEGSERGDHEASVWSPPSVGRNASHRQIACANPFFSVPREPWYHSSQRGRIQARVRRLLTLHPELTHQIPWVPSSFPASTTVADWQQWPNRIPPVDATLRDVFAPITTALAQAIHQVWWSGLPRCLELVTAIVNRWADEANHPPLSSGLILLFGIAASPQHTVPVHRDDEPWSVHVQSVSCHIYGSAQTPWVVRVRHQHRTLAMRVTLEYPSSQDIQWVLYEAATAAPPTVHIPSVLETPWPMSALVAEWAEQEGVSLHVIPHEEEPVTLPVPILPHLVRVQHWLEQHDQVISRAALPSDMWWYDAQCQIDVVRLLPKEGTATIQDDGQVWWRGHAYREEDGDLGRWFAGEQVVVRELPIRIPLLLLEWEGLLWGIAERIPSQSGSQND